MRQLKQWRLQQGLSNGAVARMLGVTAETVRRYQMPLGSRLAMRPRRAILLRLIQITGGATGLEDAFEDVAVVASGAPRLCAGAAESREAGRSEADGC